VSTVNILLRVRSGKHEEFLQAIQSIQNDLKTETGLKKTVLYRDVNDFSAFHLTEEWATQAAMEQYLRSDRFSVLMGIFKVLCTESEITYQINDQSLELVEM
jgi:quinol monooxygenase YgiN